MSRTREKIGGSILVGITTRRPGNKVAIMQQYLTPEELAFVSEVINLLTVEHLWYAKEQGEFFWLTTLKAAFAGNAIFESDEDCWLPVGQVPKYIREASPSPQVAEVLVEWFNESYLSPE